MENRDEIRVGYALLPKKVETVITPALITHVQHRPSSSRQIPMPSPQDLHPLPLESLSFPVIVKPLAADGSAKSHEMCLVFNAQALTNLQPPIVLQEFVNHGGVVFKAYVAGNHVRCVKRRSLPDACSEVESEARDGVLAFSHISNMADERDWLKEAEMPSVEFVEFLAKEFRQALGLHLFNFDMIRDLSVSDEVRYLVIDINYFPGYAKLPDFETMMIDFLCDVVKEDTHDTKDANLHGQA